MDTDREIAPSNKTQSFTESMNMSIWEVSTLNQLFKRDLYVEITFSKKKLMAKLKTFFVVSPLCIPHSIGLNTCV